MARRTKRPPITRTIHLTPTRRQCSACGGSLWNVYETQRTITTLQDVTRLTLTVVRCHNGACPRYHLPYRPEEEGSWSLPHHEFGLDVIAFIGSLRYHEHRSVPEIHRALLERGVAIAPRTVQGLLHRYEELLALRLADATHLADRLTEQGHVVLALDGLQPYKGQDVLWVARDCVSGEVLLARSLDSMRQEDLAELLREVKAALPVPLLAVVSDAQRQIRLAVQQVLPDIPHQLCQFHYLKEAAKPIVEADRQAKTDLKKYLKGVREIERTLAGRDDATAQALQGYCVAVRSAMADDAKPPLHLPGLLLHARLCAITSSLERGTQKGGVVPSWSDYARWLRQRSLPPSGTGSRSTLLTSGFNTPRPYSPTQNRRARRWWSRPIERCFRTS